MLLALLRISFLPGYAAKTSDLRRNL